MRHGAAGRRSRNRGHGRRNGGGGHNFSRTQVFDSNGPDVRIRGTAYQIQEKYAALAKDAQAAGDIVLAESYLQHAEHYQRIISGWIDFVEGRSDAYLYSTARPQESDESGPAGDDSAAIDREIELGLPASIVGTRPAVAQASREEMEEV